jgi:hypothetical protein
VGGSGEGVGWVMKWTKEIPNESGWYLVRGPGFRKCLETFEIAGEIWPPLPHIDWEDFQDCEFSPVVWPEDKAEV